MPLEIGLTKLSRSTKITAKMGDLKRLFNPATVALVGATEEEKSAGRTLLENLLHSKKRKIFAINPNRKTVLGLSCYPSIVDLPEKVDLAIVATPPPTLPQILEACGRAETEGIILITPGFDTLGEEGEKLIQQLVDIRKEYGMRMIGPESLGVIRPSIDLNASLLKMNTERGNIAFVSQGGALGGAIFDWALDFHIGFSFFVSLGLTIDVDFGDLIDFLGNDPATRSIMLYMQRVVNAKKFLSAARGFAHNKPIMVVKPGRFLPESKATLSHTGALIRCDEVYDAAFKRAGVVRVREIADFFHTARVLHSKHLPRGPRLAIITNVRWVGILATDALLHLGGQLAVISDEGLGRLDSLLPSGWSKGNPVDLIGDADRERYLNVMNICLEDSEIDGLLVIFTFQNVGSPEELAQAVVRVAKKAGKPILTVWMGGKRVQQAREIFSQNNVPTYETPEDAVKTYLYMYQYERNLGLLYETPAELSVDQAPPKNHLKALIRRVLKQGRTILNEEESKRFLVNYGIPTVNVRVTQNVEGAISIAKYVGYPIVLKILSPDITRKSDVGGVILGINSDERLRAEYDHLMRTVEENAPKAKIDGVTVQRMIEKIDYEIILGAKKDDNFGAVILFGMGGAGVQIYRDYAIGLAPLNQILARRLMEETQVNRMLQGYRGKPPADLRQLEHIIVGFSNLVSDFPEIAEMDINPIAISDGKALALDARIILDPDLLDLNPHVQYPHLVITPYPTHFVTAWRLYDGTEVLLRPIKPEDEPLEYEMLNSCSPDTLKGRFFQNIKNITHEMLIRLCNIDYDRELAVVAEIRDGQGRRVVGTGRLIVRPDLNDGEFAVIVHDDYQSKGLGYKLVDTLIGMAQEKGLEKFFGHVLCSNKKMINLVTKLGFTVENLPEEDLCKVEFAIK
jgi:acetyltransferase